MFVIDQASIRYSEEDQPAFFHSYEYLYGHKLGVIRLNPVVAERLAKDELRETLHPRHLPMLVPPKPWLSYNEGGYIYNKSRRLYHFSDIIVQLALQILLCALKTCKNNSHMSVKLPRRVTSN